tara:strand:+ start:265 stop:627 length:363 start_codon:yes stop_codon:yes gene_type:complete
MAFKLKGFPMHAGVNIKKDDCGTNLPDGRSPSSALQKKETKIEISETEYDKKVTAMRDRGMSEAEITDIMRNYKIVKNTDSDETPINKKGLWANIHAKRARGEAPAKPGDKNYPKTLDID